MKKQTIVAMEEFYSRYPQMAYMRPQIESAVAEITARVEKGGKILVCGNGGSAADCEHIVGEFLKEFYIKRPVPTAMREKMESAYGEAGKYLADNLQGSIPAISLISQSGIMTAYANDEGYENAFARQLANWAEKDDVLVVISASGNSPSVVRAAEFMHSRGGKVIAMTGFGGGKLKELSDICLHADDDHYETVEDAHSIFCHLIVSCIKSSIEQ